MAFVVKDRVKQSTTTTGTGSIVLNGTVSGFQTFTSALSDGDTTYYAIFEVSTNNWEVGVGTWTESTATLARTTVLASSNSNNAINLTAQAEVFITQPAGKAAFFDPSGDLTLVQDPTSSLQAATKQYVDTIAAAGIHYHAPVRVEHPSNLTATYNNGSSGVGATLTNSGTNAALVLDNVSMVLNDRVLVANQTDQTQNGVYTVTTVGDVSTAWVLTRSTDTDTAGPSDPDAFGKGDAFFIKEGDTNAGHLDVLTTTGTIVFGTTNIVFAEVAETTVYSAGTGLTLTGTQFAADGANITNVDAVTLDGIDSSQFLRSDTVDTKTAGNLNFSDSVKAQFGDSSDLQIYHDGSNSYISDQGTGGLRILNDSNLAFKNAAGTENKAIFKTDAEVELYYDNALKFETTSTGIEVTGTVNVPFKQVGTYTVSGINGGAVDTNGGDIVTGRIFFTGASDSGTDLFGFNNETNGLTLYNYVDGHYALYINNSNNIGIGTNSPDEALVVIGDLKVDTGASAGVIHFGDVSDQTKIVGFDSTGTIANTLLFTTGTNERMRIDSSGNVGIGNTNPSDYNSNGNNLVVGTTSGNNGISIASATSGLGSIYFADGTSGVAQYRGIVQYDHASDYMRFFTTSAERMRIDSSGNVGIGTSSPATPLNIEAAGSTSAGENTHLRINDTTNMAAGVGGVIQLSGEAASGSSTQYTFATIKGIKENGTTGNYDGALTFATRANGVSPATERMRIDSSGNVGIGTNSPDVALRINRTSTDTYSSSSSSVAVPYTANDPVTTIVNASTTNSSASYLGLLSVNSSGLTNISYIANISKSGSGQYTGDLVFGSRTGQTAYAERMRIDSSGNVGIGTTSPSQKLTINSGSSSGGLLINATTADPFVLLMETAANRGFYLSVDGNNNSGSNYSLSFVENNNGTTTNRMMITSDGNVLVGKTATTFGTEGIAAFSSADSGGSRINITNDGGTTLNLNRLTSDGEIAGFYKDGTQVGSIATEQGDLVIGTGDTGVKFNDNLNSIYPYHTDISNGSQDNSIDIGYSTVRFRNAYLSGSLSDGTTSRTVADIVGTTSSQFLRSDAADTATGTITVATGTDPAIIAKSDDWGEQLEILRNHATNWPSVKFSNTSGEKGRVFVDTSNNYLMYVKAGGSNYETVWTNYTDGSGSGLDADLLDNIEGNRMVYGDNASGSNPASATQNVYELAQYKSGFWEAYNGSWLPSTGTWWWGATFAHRSNSSSYNYSGQLAFLNGGGGDNIYARTISNGSPTSWSRLWTSGNATGAGYVDIATGDYGTIKVDDDRGTGWAGYAIQDDWVFMGRADDVGIYNDTDNEWVLYAVRNGSTYLYYDNVYKLNTTSGGVAITGALTATGDITAYYSDERLKNFEGKIDCALDKVSKLSGYYYRENDKAKELGYENDARQVGVSAQEVEAVMPEVVKPAPVDSEYKTVQYEKLVPLLIEAIKELKEEVRQLKEDKA